MKKIALLNGPNLDRLGKREPDIYGSTSLSELESALLAEAQALGVFLHCFQSNHEGALIDEINRLADEGFDGGIINPGGYTHTSVALRDALSGSGIEWLEVHISNIHRRERFRRHSYSAGACIGQISGLGISGYRIGLKFLAERDTSS